LNLSSLSIAARIAWLSALLSLLAAVSVGALLIYREHQTRLGATIDRVAAMSRPVALQDVQLSEADFAQFSDMLGQFLTLPHIKYAAFLDPSGKLIASRHSADFPAYPDTGFSTLRRDAEDFEQGRYQSSDAGSPQFLDLTQPIFGYRVRDPKQASSAQAAAKPQDAAVDSQYLIGYYHVGISLTELTDSLRTFATRLALGGGIFVLLASLATLTIARRVTAPLTRLSQLVEDVSAGRLDRQIRAESTGEVKKIASMINLLLSELQSQKLQVETDNKLLTMKVEERTAQLSKRNEELNQAVQQLTQSKHRLHQMAFYDNLTSLPNRILFIEQLDLLIRMAVREQRPIALLFIDLDNFKRINDTLGHTAGDALLKEVATRLSRCLRESDLLAKYVDAEIKIDVSRLGGDEFTVVLNNIRTPDEAGVVAERLLNTLQAPMMIDGHELVVTPSIGIAIAPRDAETVEDLLKMADTAMYNAKSGGRNSYRFFSSDMRDSTVGRLKLEADLRRAVERQELVLYYQPQVSAINGEITGAEALVRWNHPERGLVPPGQFIPIAEEMGLIVELGAWALVEACRNLTSLRNEGLRPPKVSVNVSSLQFNTAFTLLVQKALIDYRLEPEMLELELTEGVIMSNAQASIEALIELKKLGVRLSVDDFGTGYSSLSYLSQFPLDVLKIDRSFVIAFDSSERAEHLVRAIIAMGKSLNLQLVAEGVDAIPQFHFLHSAGVDLIQGYLMSKPVPIADYGQLLRNNPFPEQIHTMNQMAQPRRRAS
jgi:diguanylate cyclase (GGDEF)-like protein